MICRIPGVQAHFAGNLQASFMVFPCAMPQTENQVEALGE